MSLQESPDRVFAQPTRQIILMLLVLVAVGVGGFFLAAQIQTVFFANVYLNAFISFVFVLGVFATFWQVAQIIKAVNWLRNLQSGFKGHEFSSPPGLIASMGPMIREGRMKKRLATSTTRSILDSIAVRLDETREITRYIVGLLIFLGLLGTFWGLSQTVPAVVDTIRSLADTEDGNVLGRLINGLEDQLGGMGTAFASSLIGLAGSLIVGLLELFSSQGQNRFYRELEDYLTRFTRLGLVSEGEGPEGALISLLERVDEGLERTTQFAEEAEEARIKAEERLAAAADVVGKMASEIELERGLVSQLVKEMREAREMEAGRDHAVLTVLKRIDQGQNQMVGAQQSVAEMLERTKGGTSGGMDSDTRNYIRSMDKQLRAMADDVAVGRHEALNALRAELRALTNLIDMRTRETER